MTVKSIKNVALSEIPDLYGAVSGAADQIAAIWMESDVIDTFVVCIVVLDEAL